MSSLLTLVTSFFITGTTFTITETMHCDTYDQSLEILEAAAQSPAKGQAAYQKYLHELNDFENPSCFYHISGVSALPVRLDKTHMVVEIDGKPIYIVSAWWPAGDGTERLGFFWLPRPVYDEST